MECLQTKLRLDVATNDPRTISDFDSWYVLFFRKRTNPLACRIKCQEIIVNGKNDVFPNHMILGTEDIDDMTPIYVKNLDRDDQGGHNNFPILADFSIMHPYGNVQSSSVWNNGFPVKATTKELASYFSSSNVSISMINLNCEDVTGDISFLSTLKQTTYLGLVNANVTGDIGALSTLTKLKNLLLSKTNVTGDIEPIIEKCTSLKELHIPTTVTITDAQKKTLTDRGCTVVISG